MSKLRQRQRNIRVKADHVTDCVCSSLPSLQRVKRAGLHTVCAMVWLGVKHAESALEGGDCPHYEWLPLHMLRSRGENSLWGGSFHQRSSQYLPRFRWGGAVVAVLVGIADGSDVGNEDGRAPIFFLSYQIQRPLSEIGSPPRGSSPRKKGSTLRLSFSEEGDREDVDEFSQNVCLHKYVVNKYKTK